MIRICYISVLGYGLYAQKPNKTHDYGGAEVAVYTDAVELAKDSEFEVHVLADVNEESKFKKKNITVWTVKGSCLDNNLPFLIRYRIAFWRKLKEINADIYVQRAAPGELYFMTSVYCRLNRKKYVQILGTELTNEKQWKECSENGCKYVKKNHDIEKQVEYHKRLFKKLKITCK